MSASLWEGGVNFVSLQDTLLGRRHRGGWGDLSLEQEDLPLAHTGIEGNVKHTHSRIQGKVNNDNG